MVAITDSHFTAPDGNRYFRRNAPAVSVGGWGEIKTPLFEANYLSVAGNIRPNLLDGKIKKLAPVDVEWSRQSTAAVEASAKLYFVAGGTAAFTHSRAKEADLELVRFYIEQGTLTRLLNQEADIVRQGLKKEGNDARVCSSAWVAMSGELAERFATSASLSASGTAEGLTITASGGGQWSGSERITLRPGTVFAYGLHKVKDWDGDVIRELEDEYHGAS